jgi:MFS family permease
MILANVASEMVFALLPVYLSELGASVGQIGLTFTVAALVPLALQIFGGWLSDSIGRLRTIAIGSVAASFGYVLLPLAPSWQWGLLALCLEYIAGSLVGPSFGAFIADQSAEENRGRVFGLTKGIFLTVAVIGPLLGDSWPSALASGRCC